MDIKIFGGEYLNGMPTLDYKIKLGELFIEIKKEHLIKLIELLDNKISEDLKKAAEVKDKYDENVCQVKKLRTDLRNIFWDDLDGVFIRKSNEDLNVEKLDDILNNNDEFFGFQ